jgi:MFS transporter, DHA1 family, inner membrane transport protein
MSKQEKLLIFTLAAINFTHIVDFMIMMPLGSFLMPLFNISPQQFSYIVSSYTFSAGATSFVASFFIDRFDRKHILLFGYIGFIVGTLACALAPTYPFLLMARIVAGGFGGLIGAQVLSIIGDAVSYERRGRAMGTLMAAFSVASVVGVPLGLFLAAEFSWHAPFFLVGISGIFIIPLILLFVPNLNNHILHGDERPGPFNVISNIVQHKNLQIGLLMTFLLMLGHFPIIPFFAPYMVSNVGFTEHQLTYIYLIGGALTIFSGPMIGKIADKMGKMKTMNIFVLLSFVPIWILTNMSIVPIYLALVVTGAYFIIVGGRMIPVQAMMTSIVSQQQRGGYMSINSSLQQMASGFASLLAGAIIVKSEAGPLMNYNYVGYIAISISLVALLVARKLKTLDSEIDKKVEEVLEDPDPIIALAPEKIR